MYTRCPHCKTIFEVTAEQLRVAQGDVDCVTCAASFDAVETLADDVTMLIGIKELSAADLDDEEIFDGDDTVVDEDLVDEDLIDEDSAEAEDEPDDDADEIDADADTATLEKPDEPEISAGQWADPDADDESEDSPEEPETETRIDPDKFDAVLLGADHAAADSDSDEESPPEAMEFDAPEQTWTRYFLTDSENISPNRDLQAAPSAQEPWIGPDDADELATVTENPDEWQSLLAELEVGDARTVHQETADSEDSEAAAAIDFAEPDYDQDSGVLPAWLEDNEDFSSGEPEIDRSQVRAGLGIGLLLFVTLAAQLVHYNRDQLAANSIYGQSIRQFYAAVNSPLYPDWPLNVFEVTGTEAIAGRTSPDTLDVLANVVVGGNQPVGLPSIRIVLRDRWNAPLASRVFYPAEYLRSYDPGNPLVQPGAALPVEVSVADPGADALGYIVDVCLPRRTTGLECQLAKDPFQ